MITVPLTEILTGPIALMLLGYVLLQTIALYAAQPFRREMVAIAESMLAEKRWNEDQRAELNLMLDASLSFRVGFIMWIGVISLTIDHLLKREPAITPDQRELAADPRFEGLVVRLTASVFAANLLAAVVTVCLMGVSLLIGFVGQRVSATKMMSEVVEEPVLRALGSVGASRPAF